VHSATNLGPPLELFGQPLLHGAAIEIRLVPCPLSEIWSSRISLLCDLIEPLNITAQFADKYRHITNCRWAESVEIAQQLRHTVLYGPGLKSIGRLFRVIANDRPT